MVGLTALEPPAGGAVVTVGTFDGVHLGHRALISAAVSRARALGVAAVVVTWDRHPNETLRPGRVPAALTSRARKAELLESTGADVAAVLAFDEELSRWPPERFASDVLARGLGARCVVVGEGWRFGHRASGDAALLAQIGERLGFEVEVHALAHAHGGEISSSRVRAAIASGDVELAAQLLGRPHELEGRVIRGEQRGRALGYPTANLDVEPALARPARGVYAGEAVVADTKRAAAVNVGYNPQFGGDPATDPLRIEVHLLEFDGDLYESVLRVGFLRRLRDEQTFSSVDALVAQIARDVDAVRAPTC
jgi:riboflavin kinase/FMN adenylyltransferase